MTELVLYGKADCPLCDRLEALIRPFLAADLTLIKRDIEDDQQWLRRYRYRIPVLTGRDQVLLEGRPDPAEVARALEGLS